MESNRVRERTSRFGARAALLTLLLGTGYLLTIPRMKVNNVPPWVHKSADGTVSWFAFFIEIIGGVMGLFVLAGFVVFVVIPWLWETAFPPR